jgi:hypothetical protein
LAAGILLAGKQFAGLADDFPTYRDTIMHKVRSIRSGPGGLVGRAADTLRRLGDDITRSPAEPPVAPGASLPQPAAASPPAAAGGPALASERAQPGGLGALSWTIMGSVFEPLSAAAIVILLLIMMLMSRENIRDRIIRLAGLHQIGFTTQTLEEAGARVGRYLRAQLLIHTIVAVAVGTGLFILGLPKRRPVRPHGRRDAVHPRPGALARRRDSRGPRRGRL